MLRCKVLQIVPLPPSGALVSSQHSVSSEIALSNVERGHKLYKSSNQGDRATYFSLATGYYAALPALTALPSGKRRPGLAPSICTSQGLQNVLQTHFKQNICVGCVWKWKPEKGAPLGIVKDVGLTHCTLANPNSSGALLTARASP